MITHELHKMSVKRLIHACFKALAVYVKEGFSVIVVHQSLVAFLEMGLTAVAFHFLSNIFSRLMFLKNFVEC